jgi:hypothetical protein
MQLNLLVVDSRLLRLPINSKNLFSIQIVVSVLRQNVTGLRAPALQISMAHSGRSRRYNVCVVPWNEPRGLWFADFQGLSVRVHSYISPMFSKLDNLCLMVNNGRSSNFELSSIATLTTKVLQDTRRCEVSLYA